jgi:hypothetical protein
MTMRKSMIGVALAAALVAGGGGLVAASPRDGAPANCFGQHVSAMAREHGGMAKATAYHNAKHGTDLSVGEHQAHMRDEMCGR